MQLAYAKAFPPVEIKAVSQALQVEPRVVAAPRTASKGMPLSQILVLGAVLLWLYFSTLAHLVRQWSHDPNFSHGFFVPLFSAFVIWQERSRLSRLALRPSSWGALVLASGLCLLVLGQLGAEIFLARFSLIIVLAGLTILFAGWEYFRAILLPLAFLLMMIPIPAIVFNQITFPLQLVASRVASTILPWLGVPVLREGNLIVLPGMTLEVADACSGIRSLMSLATLAVIYGYLMDRRLWVRWLLALASLPVAVAANSLRVVVTGLLVQYLNDPEKAKGFFHEFQGWLMFVASLLMIYLLHKAILLFWPAKETA
jgi:exosortase